VPIPWHRLIHITRPHQFQSSPNTSVPHPRSSTSVPDSPGSPLTPLPNEEEDNDDVEVMHLEPEIEYDPAIHYPPNDPLPFLITSSPSQSCLVRKITPQMAPTWRGPNPDPLARALKKAEKDALKKAKLEAEPDEQDEQEYFPVFQPKTSKQKPKDKRRIHLPLGIQFNTITAPKKTQKNNPS